MSFSQQQQQQSDVDPQQQQQQYQQFLEYQQQLQTMQAHHPMNHTQVSFRLYSIRKGPSNDLVEFSFLRTFKLDIL